jgi:hypothetical protein
VTAGILAVLAVQALFQNLVILVAAAAACAFASAFQSFRWRLIPTAVVLGAASTLVPYAGLLQRRAEWNELGSAQVRWRDLWSGFWALASDGGPVAAACLVFLLTTAGVIGGGALWRRFRRLGAESGPARLAPADVVSLAPAMALASVAALGAFYQALGYPTQAWYYIGVLAVVAMLAEVTIRSAVRTWTPAVRIAAALVLLAGVASARGPMREPLTNVDVIAARLDKEARGGDLILTHPWFLGVTLSRYYRGPAEVVTIPPIEDRTVSRYDLLKRQMTRLHVVQPVIAAIDRALSSGHRVWLVGDYELPPDGIPDVALRLPPPPLPDSGWNSAPYETLWAFQVGGHLRKHAVYDVVVRVRRGGRLEDVALRRFSGRRQ